MTQTTATPSKGRSQAAKTPAPRKATVPAPKKSTTTSSGAPSQAASKNPRAKPVTPKPVAKQAATAPAKPLKDKKVKVVRDSFTIPKTELLQIADMKKRALGLGVEIKKSELIRAGLQALLGLTDVSFKKALSSVPTIKTGRPAKD
ncbi:MAG: hypothetical protein WBJ45_08840 [Limnohabitans sp.]|uniref:hypothetical protein n=1 Tax=Limnohabitans sp. TaxID=1907725 RepID=UPI003BB1D22D